MAIISSMEQLARCPRCGETKGFSEFYSAKNYCKSCTCEANSLHRRKTREKGNAMKRRARLRYAEKWKRADPYANPDPKSCGLCGVKKSRCEFSRNGNRYDGLSSRCRSCQQSATSKRYRSDDAFRMKLSEGSRKHYLANRERRLRQLAESKKKWLKTESGKAYSKRQRYLRRSLPATLTAEEWELILRLQNFRCAKCKSIFGLFEPAHRDHIIPASKGGGLTLQNVQALCIRCNGGKRDKDTDYRTREHKAALVKKKAK